jgi:hypothetical protein
VTSDYNGDGDGSNAYMGSRNERAID